MPSDQISSVESINPVVPAHKNLPEITPKAVILGIFLAMLLAGSNAYLALKVGQTVTACIPAAVVSMAVLRLFRRSNILENNMVQTIVSAGEGIAVAMIFTLPALVLMGFWTRFPFLESTAVAAVGGIMGVLFSVPLRRAMIVDHPLPFPEGVATAEVLKFGDGASKGAQNMLIGAAFAALLKLAQGGFMIIGEVVEGAGRIGSTVIGCGIGLTPAIMGAGYIMGIRIGIMIVAGGILMWGIGVPLYGLVYGLPEGSETALGAVMEIWKTKLRYVGVGTMIVGGIWAIFVLIKPISQAFRTSFAALREAHLGAPRHIPRTERDIPMNTILLGSALLTIPVFIVFAHVINQHDMPVSSGLFWGTVAFSTVLAFFLGFLCSAIGGYMAGIVGSSSTPISGITISAILCVSLGLLVILGTELNFDLHPDDALSAAATAVLVGGMVAGASVLSCDNLQDLKTGQLVGATPWKQQLMLAIGVIAGAIVVSPIMQVLLEAYGMGTVMPRPDMDPNQVLPAPQATLMAAIAKGVFLHNLEWLWVGIGVGIGLLLGVINIVFKTLGKSFQIPILAVAFGAYLPYQATSALAIGAVVSYFVQRNLQRKEKAGGISLEQKEGLGRQALLFASGAIAGEALIGIFLAIPFAIYESTSIFQINIGYGREGGMALGALAMGLFGFYFYRVATTVKMGELNQEESV